MPARLEGTVWNKQRATDPVLPGVEIEEPRASNSWGSRKKGSVYVIGTATIIFSATSTKTAYYFFIYACYRNKRVPVTSQREEENMGLELRN
jgi:hypothetical protein